MDMRHPLEKVRESGNDRVFITERGFSFGYNNLVVDMRAFPMMRALGAPIVFDVTHSLQLPGGGAGVTGLGQHRGAGERRRVGAGVDGIFRRFTKTRRKPRATRTRLTSRGSRRSSIDSNRSMPSSRT